MKNMRTRFSTLNVIWPTGMTAKSPGCSSAVAPSAARPVSRRVDLSPEGAAAAC